MAAVRTATLDDDDWDALAEGHPGKAEPGLLLIFSGERPAFGVIPLVDGAIEIERGEVAGVDIDDKHMSRPHARIRFDGRAWSARDLGSRNGTAADGDMVAAEAEAPVRKVVRAGRTLFLLAADTRPYGSGIVRSEEMVMGPVLQRAVAAIARAARNGRVLHITGESGSGKELAARAFHDTGPASDGPFVAVNAATLQPALAESELFGARKGAASGVSSDRLGYIQSSHGGTLFLDEVAELDLAVQAKLLRVLEKREVVRLGDPRAEKVDFRLCSATHANLKGMVAAGKMREDLYFRIATPAVELPPLRDRLEEIPWLVDLAVRGVQGAGRPIAVHFSFVEECLLRVWPGNVRELLSAVKTAAQWAAEDGGVLSPRHLDKHAGTPAAPPPTAVKAAPAASRRPSDEAIDEALRAAGDNKAAAARALGVHRTQLNRWLAQRGRPAKGDEEDG